MFELFLVLVCMWIIFSYPIFQWAFFVHSVEGKLKFQIHKQKLTRIGKMVILILCLPFAIIYFVSLIARVFWYKIIFKEEK